MPTRWLLEKGYVNAVAKAFKVLDFGCGKCHNINPPDWFNYDPHYMPMTLSAFRGQFDIILCNYVLCTLPEQERIQVLTEIQSLLTEKGVAYISVRADRPQQGWGLSSKGTYQGRCKHLPGELLHKNSQFRIYSLTKAARIA